ncbi:MAG: hypothetical protein RTU09_02290 [Candidatus Thorarchaeota archaeon]
MQPELYTDAIYGIPSLFVGFVLGYIVGGMKSLKTSDRLLLGLASSTIGGLTIVLALTAYLPYSAPGVILSILAFGGGFIFGAGTHWEAPAEPKPKSHIIYEHEDEDEFDREIEKVFEPDNQ